jgi:hypothetical protein
LGSILTPYSAPRIDAISLAEGLTPKFEGPPFSRILGTVVGEHSMPKLKIAFLAGALAVAGSPALAFELPDTGSKNFSASGDTPTYFKNEAAPVSARTADTSESDWSAVDEAAPANFEPAIGRNLGHRHGRYAMGRRSGNHAAAGASAKAAAGQYAKTHPGRSTRAAPSGAAKNLRARHGKSGAPRA